MAIKRCPYCRALIDEKEQYCNNCGTQLLFPEDGQVEEEIPGDKIIDADVEEKDYEIPEPGAEASGRDDDEEGTGDVDEDEDDEEEVELDAGEEPDEDDEEDEEEAEEVVLIDEPEREEAPKEPEPALPSPVPEPVPGKPFGEPTAAPPPSAPPAPSKKPMTFDTSDLDKIGRTAEFGKEQVESFLDVLKERGEQARLVRAGAGSVPEEGLPPWAAQMKGGASEEPPKVKVEMMPEDEIEDRELEEPEGAEDEEAELEEGPPLPPVRPRIADSGIGLPEKVTQAALPFEREAPREEKAAAPAAPPIAERRIERPLEEAEEPEEEEREERARPRGPFRLSAFLKAKGFDALFIAVFWLVSLWIAARSMDVTLFQMLGKASTGLLAYFAALLALYFFLFYFFLGETLGDRLFRDDD